MNDVPVIAIVDDDVSVRRSLTPGSVLANGRDFRTIAILEGYPRFERLRGPRRYMNEMSGFISRNDSRPVIY